jgi:hypothetical protein
VYKVAFTTVAGMKIITGLTSQIEIDDVSPVKDVTIFLDFTNNSS